MAYEDDRDQSSPFIPLRDVEATDAALPAGWEAATEYHRLKRVLPSGPLRIRVREAAISAVLERALQCVRHAGRPTRLESAGWIEEPSGDLDLNGSLDAGILLEPEDPSRLRVTVREPRRASIVLILDMSLSMTGEKIALVAVAAAVLALKLTSEELAVVTFDSTATPLKRLGEKVSPRELVRRVLEVPARGYTHLEGGLREGLRLLRDSRVPQRAGVLMTDGIYNVGWDPAPLAPLFPRLHVIQLGEEDAEKNDRGLCRRLASGGRGRYYRAEQYEDLPAMTYRLVQDLFR